MSKAFHLKVIAVIAICFLSLSSNAQYSGGTGEPNNPYKIATAQDLIALGNEPNDYNKHFIMTSDIDLTGYVFEEAVIAPDTNDVTSLFVGNSFTGTFDGNDHIISHLTINGKYYLGLFGQTDSGASISNLGIEAIDVNGTDRFYIGGLVGANYGDITSCYSDGNVSGHDYVGGLGGVNNGNITLSYSTGNVSCEGDRAGSFVGCNYETIVSCYSSGSISGHNYVGGLVGVNLGEIVSCYSSGTVSGNDNVGGLLGLNYYNNIASCYSTSIVNGTGSNIGGFVGKNNGGSTIVSCYSTGIVNSAGYYVGGFAGNNYGTVIFSFWDIETSGYPNSAGGIGLSTTQMQDINTFLDAGWDFVNEKANGTCNFWTMWTDNYPSLSVFSGYNPTKPNGSGTLDDPYLLTDSNDLGFVWYNHKAHYRLGADIDLSGITWSMAVIPVFKGYFEGNGHIIYHLLIDGGGYLGLIGTCSFEAIISNLGLEEIDVNSSGGGNYVSGLAGKNFGYIVSCYSLGNISGGKYVGGLAGYNRGPITMCYSMANIKSGGDNIGGLVGINSFYSTITSCYSSGNINGNDFVGGLAGANEGTVTTSYSTCSVSGENGVGGLFGINSSDRVNLYPPITSCYSNGTVSGNSYVGGLVGINSNGGLMTSCFWDIETSGQSTSDGGIGKTTAEMQTQNTFTDAGWDFVGETANGPNDIWRILEGLDYPRLWWENIYVDDDAVGDPLENGRREHPFDTIQEAINFANDESNILVMPGVYDNINFWGKSITISGYKGAATIVANPGTGDAVTFYSGEDSNSVLKNFIIKNSDLAISLNYGSNPTIQGITFVNNLFGIAAYEDSNPDIRNCIFYNNTDGDLFGCDAWYSCFEGGTLDRYNIDADPLFVDAANGDYHLKSEGWRWNEQSESWTWDDVTSPCIDAGDPNTPLGDEPMSIPRDPNNLYGRNNRINMGAYSGTPQASMPPLGWIPINVDDFTSPSPNPAQWEINGLPKEVQHNEPNVTITYTIEMEAETATDSSGFVEYYFDCISDSSYSSGWITEPYYSVPVSDTGSGLIFRVKTRDAFLNETFWSSEEQTIPLDISNN